MFMGVNSMGVHQVPPPLGPDQEELGRHGAHQP
jgi:hypothetical protein